MKDGTPVSRPQEISLKDTPRVTSVKRSQDLVLECPRGQFSYHCQGEKCEVRVCGETAEIGVEVTKLSFLQQLPSMAAALLRREPVEAVVAAVRGDDPPSDAVVRQEPRGVHWAPALTRIFEGRYCFRLTHIPPDARPVRTFNLDWDPNVEKEAVVPVADLKPGLYSLAKGAPAAGGGCTLDNPTPPAWVLVAPQNAFDEVNRQWVTDSSQVDILGQSDTSTSVLTTLHHAILASLADSLEEK